MAKHLLSLLLRGSTIAIITPMRQASTCGWVWTLARLQVLQNSGSRIFMLRVKNLSARDRHWRNPRKTKSQRAQQYKSARVSVLMGSVPRKMAKGLQGVSSPGSPWGNRTQVARLTASRLNHWAICSYQLAKKNGSWLVVSRNLELLFCVQDCHSRIAQAEYQGQTRYTRILEGKRSANLWLIHLITYIGPTT